jgi:hypothetical protein
MAKRQKNLPQAADKKTESASKREKAERKAKANPDLALAKKEKNDACRDRRLESGSKKSMN